jgi:hypothetical protein
MTSCASTPALIPMLVMSMLLLVLHWLPSGGLSTTVTLTGIHATDIDSSPSLNNKWPAILYASHYQLGCLSGLYHSRTRLFQLIGRQANDGHTWSRSRETHRTSPRDLHRARQSRRDATMARSVAGTPRKGHRTARKSSGGKAPRKGLSTNVGQAPVAAAGASRRGSDIDRGACC